MTPIGTTARRRTLLGMLCGVLTGCQAVVGGTAQPADHDGPVPVPNSSLRRALLDGDELDTTLGASGIERKGTREDLMEDSTSFSDPSCLVAWQPILESVYADSGWSAVRAAVLHDNADTDSSDHLVVEGVVGFPSRSDVTTFLAEVKPKFEACGGRQFSSRRSDGLQTRWDFDTAVSTATTVSMTRTQQDTNGWSCQHTMRASNNVVIDVVACVFDVADEATEVADAIDAKLPSI